MLEASAGERKTVIFVIALLMLGLGLSWIKNNLPQVSARIIHFDDRDNMPASHTPHALHTNQKCAISINEATIEELTSLPGVGSVIARRIVEYRQKHGPFQSFDALLSVKGIGREKLRRIRPYIRFTDFDSTGIM